MVKVNDFFITPPYLDKLTLVKSLQMQSVLFHNFKVDIYRSFSSALSAMIDLKQNVEEISLSIFLGDCSKTPILEPDDIAFLTKNSSELGIDFNYVFFGKNIGSASGHNKLAKMTESQFIFVLNPDVVLAPTALTRSYSRFDEDKVGLVESKQVPIEHPKSYNPTTGDTEWATTAAALIARKPFIEVGCFDSDFFFLYCDDLDLSWRFRLNGYRVIHEPSSLAYHDKRLSKTGEWLPSKAEIYYSAEAALFLAYKWSNPKRLRKLEKQFRSSNDPILKSALEAFMEKISGLENYNFLDGENEIANFKDEIYALPRYKL